MTDTGSTGIPALDRALMNGVPKGFLVLVTGIPGSGLELFAKQFAAAAARNETTLYFTTSERDEDILDTMKDFGWKADLKIVNVGNQYYESVLARRLEASRNREEGISVKDLHPTKEEEGASRQTVNFLTTLAYEISGLEPPFRVTVDALDFFLEYYDHAEVLSALRTVKAHVQRAGGLILLTMLSGVYDTRTQSGVEEIVDCIFELERAREGGSFKRYLVIRKVRNHPEKTGIHPLGLTKDGLEIE